jgi:hypothetical protein
MAAWPSSLCVRLDIKRSALVRNPSRLNYYFLPKETLHSLVSTGLFQERIRGRVFKVDRSTVDTYSIGISNIDKTIEMNHFDILIKCWLNKKC